MSLTDDVMEACLCKAMDDVSPSRARNEGCLYMDLIKVHYEINYAQEEHDHYIKQLRLKGI